MTPKKRLMFVFGTRPEAIKMAPVISAAKQHEDIFDSIIVVTGQHRHMLDQVLRLFDIDPDYDLGIMEENQALSGIVTKTLKGLEEIILRERPDILLVQGDTASAFAAGLAAYYYRLPLGHVEAGLRTFDKWRPFPEEMNRHLLSVLADLHFTPTRQSSSNLLAENVPQEKIYLTGNSVIDALLDVAKREYDINKIGFKLMTNRKLVLVTTHRRESFGQPLINVCQAIKKLAETFSREIQVVLPVHKNPQVKGVVEEKLGRINNVLLIEPQDYEPFVHLMKAAYLILTDSGGVQEEAPSLGKPVLVLREKTERPEAVAAGVVKLVGMDEKLIFETASQLLTDQAAYNKMAQAVNPYGDGLASRRIIGAILHYLGVSDRKPEEFKC